MYLKINNVLRYFLLGDSIIIYPHANCPVDGIVIEGHGSMDESYLTGEPYQISKVPGTSVLSGAINGETVLTIQAQKMPSESRYASIVNVLQEAEQKRPALRRLGDQIGAVFAPIALVLAFLTWYISGDAIRFLAVLVIATPCPLLIAIPITVISAIGGMTLSVIGMGFAAAGFLTPVAGAIIQEVIDVIAIMNALQLIWGKNIEIDI